MSARSFLEFHQSFTVEANEVQMPKILNSRDRHINAGLTRNKANRFSN